MADPLAQPRDLLARAQRVAAMTGPGISAESGVPDFQKDELWRNHKIEDLTTPEAFARNPGLVWELYEYRRGRMKDVQPNLGHFALAKLEKQKKRCTLTTQNVDGLHRLAGTKHVLELHGNIWMLRCTKCGRQGEDRRVPLPSLPPKCRCGGVVRPGVVWFGETLPTHHLETSMEAAHRCDVMLLVGTSAIVYPAAGVAEAAIHAGAAVIEVNPEETPFSNHVTYSIRGKAGDVLPRLI